MLWDLSTDYYLHHAHPRAWTANERRQYTHWYLPEHIDTRHAPKVSHSRGPTNDKPMSYFDDYWLEYYRPLALSSFTKIFSYKMNSTLRYIPFKSAREGKYDLSPFRVRDRHEHQSPEKGNARKEVTIQEPGKEGATKRVEPRAQNGSQSGERTLPAWLQNQLDQPRTQQSILKDSAMNKEISSSISKPPKEKKTMEDKAAATQWTLDQFVTNSLNPSVTNKEAHEYQRYINHPLNLPLVVSTEVPTNPSAEIVSYVNSITAISSANMPTTDDDLDDFKEFLEVGDNPLTVTDADTAKKRYKAYRQWVKGKSLFKQRVEV